MQEQKDQQKISKRISFFFLDLCDFAKKKNRICIRKVACVFEFMHIRNAALSGIFC